ncbi:hypothetical protein RB596_004474 [Gaeumannomyces avenae]
MDGQTLAANGVRTLPLTVLDQTAPRIYVRLVFTFGLQDAYNADAARDHLAARLHRALRRWPFLAGQLRPARAAAVTYTVGGDMMETAGPDPRGSLELVFDPDDAAAADPLLRPDIFLYDMQERALIGGEAVPYAALAARGMPPSVMDKDVFSLSPQHPQPGASCPPVTLKVTELAGGGGLFVCFAFHHGIIDGGFIRTFLNYFGGGGGGNNDNDQAFEHGGGYEAELGRMQSLDGTLAQQWAMVFHDELPEYDFGDGSSGNELGDEAGSGGGGGRAVCRIIRFDHAVIETLRSRALLEQPPGGGGFLSTVDVLCALVQVHVCRARYKAGLEKGGDGNSGSVRRISPDDPAAFSTAADFRDRAGPYRARDSWGNLWAPIMVSDSGASVRRLIALGDDSDDDGAAAVPEDAIPAVLAQARRIRSAIAAAADIDYMPKRIALARQLLVSDTRSARGSVSSSSSGYSGCSESSGYATSLSSVGGSSGSICDGGEAHAVLGSAHGRALQPGRAGLGCSVWAHMGADVDFAIPGTTTAATATATAGDGRADFVRKTWSASDGSMNVMQRRGGTRGAAEPWEVLLALRERDMEWLCRDDELGRWASGWVE